MAVYFLETSAVVKRYVQETGTVWVQGLAMPALNNVLFIAQIAGVETVAAVTLRARRGNTTANDAAIAIADFRHDFVSEYSSIQITANIIVRAMDLAEKHGLRGYDAVQLASALQVQTRSLVHGGSLPIFISADANLNAAAVTEGLTVDNPNAHP